MPNGVSEDPKNQEEVVRDVRDYLNKNTKPEDCWTLNISWAISQYLKLLDGVEESEALESEDVDLFDGRAGSHLKRPGGINFCLAGSLLFDATRAFAKKVDYLGATLNSTLNNLTSGNVQGTKLKKGRIKKGARNAKGISGLPGWLIPEVPESLEMMHLPWGYLNCKHGEELLLSEEASFHTKATNVLNGSKDDGVESFAERLLNESANITYPEVLLCVDFKTIAAQRKICLTRPAICLMPRTQRSSSEKSGAENRDKNAFDSAGLTNLLESYKLTDCPMDVSGALFLPFLKKGASAVSSGGANSIRLEGSCRIETGHDAVPTPGVPSVIPGTSTTGISVVNPHTANFPEPRTSLLRTSVGFGGGVDQTEGRHSTQGGTQGHDLRPATASTAKKTKSVVSRLDEHEVVGKDCPLKVGKSSNKPANLELYNLKLGDIDCAEVIELLVNGSKQYVSMPAEEKLPIAWKINEWKIRKKLKTKPRGQKDWDSVQDEKCMTVSEKAEKLKINLNCHPLFEEVKIGASPLDPYLLNDPCFSAITDKLISRLQPPRRVVTFKEGTVFGMNPDGEIVEPGSPGENHTPDFHADSPMMDGDDMEQGIPWGGNQSALAQTLQAASTMAGRMSILSQAQTPQLKESKNEQKSSLFELHQRVWRWRARVEKWISFTTNLEPFLVPTYVSRVADHLRATRQDENGAQESVINFRDMVKDKRKHEICRLFLTTLILANQHNFKISNTVDPDGKGNLIVEVGDVEAQSLTQDYFEAAQENIHQQQRLNNNRALTSTTAEENEDDEESGQELAPPPAPALSRKKPNVRGKRAVAMSDSSSTESARVRDYSGKKIRKL